MIAKISGGKNIYGLIAYHLKKISNEKANVLLTHKCYTGESRTAGDFARCFEPYLTQETRSRNVVFHASLNPAEGDNLTDTQLTQIAEEYMQKMGYGKQPYVIIKHTDIDREHIHIISVRIDKDGKNINNDFEYRRSFQLCREIERKYGLNQAVKRERKENIPLKKVDYQAADLKKQIGSVLKGLSSYRCSSWGEYCTLLAYYNINVQEQSGEIAGGKKYFGIVYSALDEDGKIVSKSLKASLFGRYHGHTSLQKRFWQSNQIIAKTETKDQTRRIIAAVMQQCSKQKDFEQELKKKGIDVIFRENKQGRIYGITFIDHNARIVCNGSMLGKEFSANAFHDFFSAPSQSLPDMNNLPSQRIECATLSGNDFTGLFFESLSGSNDYAPTPDDALLREQRKRKKKKRGLHL